MYMTSPPLAHPQASISDELKLVKITEVRPPGLWTYLKRQWAVKYKNFYWKNFLISTCIIKSTVLHIAHVISIHIPLDVVYFQVASNTVEQFHETVAFKGHDAQRYGRICIMRAWHVWLGSGMQRCLTERFNPILTHQGWIWLCLVWGPISLKV